MHTTPFGIPLGHRGPSVMQYCMQALVISCQPLSLVVADFWNILYFPLWLGWWPNLTEFFHGENPPFTLLTLRFFHWPELWLQQDSHSNCLCQAWGTTRRFMHKWFSYCTVPYLQLSNPRLSSQLHLPKFDSRGQCTRRKKKKKAGKKRKSTGKNKKSKKDKGKRAGDRCRSALYGLWLKDLQF